MDLMRSAFHSVPRTKCMQYDSCHLLCVVLFIRRLWKSMSVMCVSIKRSCCPRKQSRTLNMVHSRSSQIQNQVETLTDSCGRSDFHPKGALCSVGVLPRMLWVRVWLFLVAMATLVSGHGRLREPPSRASMWREGYSTPANYDDNGMNCGGFYYQWQVMGGKCGACGDPWRRNRQHEGDGQFSRGILTRNYSPGQVISVTIQITAHHEGYFEFHLCPLNNPFSRQVPQACLEHYTLPLADGSGTKYDVTGKYYSWHHIRLRLPPDLTCRHCFFQWKYNTGNRWGCESADECGKGLGKQEQFYGCADISIGGPPVNPPPRVVRHPQGPSYHSYHPARPAGPPAPSNNRVPPVSFVRPVDRPISNARPVTSHVRPVISQSHPMTSHSRPATSVIQHLIGQPTGRECRATMPWRHHPAMDKWCHHNCALGYCPPSHCVCSWRGSDFTVVKSCHANGIWNLVKGMDQWCGLNCSPQFCPHTKYCMCV